MAKTNGTLKILGVIAGILMLIGGWVYAGIMSGYTRRIETLEVKADDNRNDINDLLIWRAHEEEWFKSINEKLDKLNKVH